MKVVLYNISLVAQADDVSVVYSDKTSQSSSEQQPWSSSPNRLLYDALLCRWKELGVLVVACQKLVDPYLVQQAARWGISVLERLSIRHIDSVRIIAGGVVLSSLDVSAITERCLGSLSQVRPVQHAGRRFIHLRSSEKGGSAIYTVLMRAPEGSLGSDIEAVTDSVLASLSLAVQVPWVVPGAGVTEVWLGEYLNAEVDRLTASVEPAVSAASLQGSILVALRLIARCLIHLGVSLRQGASASFASDEEEQADEEEEEEDMFSRMDSAVAGTSVLLLLGDKIRTKQKPSRLLGIGNVTVVDSSSSSSSPAAPAAPAAAVSVYRIHSQAISPSSSPSSPSSSSSTCSLYVTADGAWQPRSMANQKHSSSSSEAEAAAGAEAGAGGGGVDVVDVWHVKRATILGALDAAETVWRVNGCVTDGRVKT